MNKKSRIPLKLLETGQVWRMKGSHHDINLVGSFAAKTYGNRRRSFARDLPWWCRISNQFRERGMGRGAGFKSDTTRHSWGERSRVGHGTWPWLLASPMTNTGTRTGKSS